MTPDELYAVMDQTWPAASTTKAGPFTLRDGQDGGKRVSAATCEGAWTPADIDAAEAAMEEPLFMIRPGNEALDAALGARGYHAVDRTVAYAAPVEALAAPLPPLTAFPHWPPLAVATTLWEEGGIGPNRIAVMERAPGAKSVILGRINDRPAGVVFVAKHGTVAMFHALEVGPRFRRHGMGRNLLRACANWAQDAGADTLSLLVTERNTAARELYASAGMQVVGQYHYRRR